MKNRFLSLLICAILVFSIIPFGKNIKASQTNNNAKQLNTPEQMAAVMREKANNNIARMKGKITQSQVNATIKQKLIVKTRDRSARPARPEKLYRRPPHAARLYATPPDCRLAAARGAAARALCPVDVEARRDEPAEGPLARLFYDI